MTAIGHAGLKRIQIGELVTVSAVVVVVIAAALVDISRY